MQSPMLPKLCLFSSAITILITPSHLFTTAFSHNSIDTINLSKDHQDSDNKTSFINFTSIVSNDVLNNDKPTRAHTIDGFHRKDSGIADLKPKLIFKLKNALRLKRAFGNGTLKKKKSKSNTSKKRSTTWTMGGSNASQSSNISVHNSTVSNEMTSMPLKLDQPTPEEACCKFKKVSNNTHCKIFAIDIHMNSKVRYMTLKERLNLIEYSLSFPNYTSNPLFVNSTIHHRPNVWSRASTNYGQTLLSLAFNYGILSLMTLTFGTTKVLVELTDDPERCFGTLEFDERLALVRDLLMKDFGAKETDHVSESGEDIEQMYITESARICHEVVENDDGYAQFTDCCCYRHRFTGEKKCENGSDNFWLSFLYSMLSFIRYVIFFFGPLLFLSTMVGLTRDQFPYTVKLKDPLLKSVFLCKSDTEIPDNIRYKHLLDFSHKSTFPKMKESLSTAIQELEELRKEENQIKLEGNVSKESLPHEEKQMELPKSIFGTPIRVAIKDYELFINYKRLVTENDISIGFWKTITNTLFFCKLKNVGPFQSCCRKSMFRYFPLPRKSQSEPMPWINCWKVVGLIFFALFLPSPFYLRLLILYNFELDEVLSRKTLIAELGLKEKFENSLLLYFLPTHPLYICIGVLYAIVSVFCIIFSKQHEDGKFKTIVTASFNDLKYLSWTEVLNLLVSNIIWPFKRFGVLGCFVVLLYWPVVIPLTLFVFIIYCLPTMFITARMLYNTHKTFHEKRIKRVKKSYRITKKPDNNLHYFKIENIIANFLKPSSCFIIEEPEDFEDDDIENKCFKDKEAFRGMIETQTSRISYNLDEIDNFKLSALSRLRSRSLSSTVVQFDDKNMPFQYMGQIFVSIVCILVLYSFLIIVTECLGSLVDILVFTLMGIIVNAGKLLKYIALAIMIVVYSYDSFNNVEKKYLKLNKALFTEVKCRIKDLDKVTSLPSYLQENRGFKSQELNEQAEYELGDNVSVKPPRHWFLNDVVLFVDNEDMPRIPKKLFKNVCEIKVAGVPGPVYQGLMLAMKQFLKIIVFILFVFMVVLTFGSVYQMSNTNQMLAALAGGSLPFILRTFMEPDKPDIEMGTVSFKSKLDEVIKNFSQIWPMYDFSFELYKEEKPEGDENEKEEDDLKRRGSVKSAILPSNKSFDDDLNNNKVDSKKYDRKDETADKQNLRDEKLQSKKDDTKKEENNKDAQKDSLLKGNEKKNEALVQEKKKSCLRDPPKVVSKEKLKKKLSTLKLPSPVSSPVTRIILCSNPTDHPRNFPIFYSNDNIFSEYISDTAMQEERREEEVPVLSHREVGPTKSNLSARVCFTEPAKSIYEQVDLLIIVPQSFEETIKLNSEPIFLSEV